MPTLIQSSDNRWTGPAMRPTVVPPNKRFELSREYHLRWTKEEESMLEIKQLRFESAHPRVAQPHR